MAKGKHTQIKVDEPTWRAAKARAAVMGMSLGHYFAKLLMADLDASKEVESEIKVNSIPSLR